jgi:hypothetical protein
LRSSLRTLVSSRYSAGSLKARSPGPCHGPAGFRNHRP